MTESTKRAVSNPPGPAVLGLLAESPMHPHAMASALRERGMDRVFKVTTGSLYDVVRALERAEWIEVRETVRVGARPERTVYQHTGLGRAEFVRWVDELVRVPADEYPKFLSAVTYLGALDPDHAVSALRERPGGCARRWRRSVGAPRTLEDAGVPRLFVVRSSTRCGCWKPSWAGWRRSPPTSRQVGCRGRGRDRSRRGPMRTRGVDGRRGGRAGPAGWCRRRSWRRPASGCRWWTGRPAVAVLPRLHAQRPQPRAAGPARRRRPLSPRGDRAVRQVGSFAPNWSRWRAVGARAPPNCSARPPVFLRFGAPAGGRPR
ncbi:PadR family transcriptional regulator [Saccharothrix sp. MB29]|nr:PadR family transcriptional regulator [Saccharothrix sp. MB29]